MEKEIQEYVLYLRQVKGTSENTQAAYSRDLKKAAAFFYQRNVSEPSMIEEEDLKEYLQEMENQKLSPATVSRNIAALRSFFQYLTEQNRIEKDPSADLKPPKVEKKMPAVLTVNEVDLLMEQPDLNTAKGLRDKAMLELLYATGIRVSELIHLKEKDISMNGNYIFCSEKGKERMIPFGDTAKRALKEYRKHGREELLKGKECGCYFCNCSGGAMSRQGFWKVMKAYALQAGITKDITPQTLRHSFAMHMIRNGADLKSVQEMMGHSAISTTQMYLDLELAGLREVYAKAHPRQ